MLSGSSGHSEGDENVPSGSSGSVFTTKRDHDISSDYCHEEVEAAPQTVVYLDNGDKKRKIPERPLQRKNERFARVAFIVALIGSAACDVLHKPPGDQALERLPVLYVRMEKIARKANDVLFGTL